MKPCKASVIIAVVCTTLVLAYIASVVFWALPERGIHTKAFAEASMVAMAMRLYAFDHRSDEGHLIYPSTLQDFKDTDYLATDFLPLLLNPEGYIFPLSSLPTPEDSNVVILVAVFREQISIFHSDGTHERVFPGPGD